MLMIFWNWVQHNLIFAIFGLSKFFQGPPRQFFGDPKKILEALKKFFEGYNFIRIRNLTLAGKMIILL